MNKKTMFLIVCAVFFVFGLLIFISVRSSGFRLVESIPEINGEVSTSTGTIKLIFSKKLDSSLNYNEQIEGENADTVIGVNVEGENLLLVMHPLKENSSYDFSVKNIRSVDGDTISSVPVVFTTKYIPFTQLPKEQQEFELSQTDRGNQENTMQQHLPFQGDGFYLSGEYTSNEDGETIFIINAQILFTRDDLANRTAALDKYKQMIAEYIQSKNLNPDEQLIRYIINEPPANPN